VEESLHVVVTRHEPESQWRYEMNGILVAQAMQKRRGIVSGNQIEEDVLAAGLRGGGRIHAEPPKRAQQSHLTE
jgi:hypothetical protein